MSERPTAQRPEAKANGRKVFLLDCRLRRLIVNADDFGLTRGVNRAIVEAHRDGIVTSATLMANGAAFDDAASLARTTLQLGIGCHVVLVDGRPVLSAEKVPSLINPGSGSRFHDSLVGFAYGAVTGRIRPDELEAEVAEQIKKLQDAGLSVSHVDTHKHTHVLPQVLCPLLRAARSCGVGAVRNPFERLHISMLSGRLRLWKQYGMIKSLSGLARSFRNEVAAAGMVTCDGTIGLATTGFLDQAVLRHLIDALPEGSWEMVCHPGYNDAELAQVKTRLRESRVQELQILTSRETRDLLASGGIQLISYSDLG